MNVWQPYLDKLDDEKREIVLSVLERAREYIAQPSEGLNYGVPTLKQGDEPIIAVAAHKNHLGVYPFSGSIVEEIEDQLTGLEYSKGTIKFPYDNLPSDELLKMIVEAKLGA